MSIFKPWSDEKALAYHCIDPKIYFPTQDFNLQNFIYKFNQMWIVDHINFSRDLTGFQTLPRPIQETLRRVLLFFLKAETEIIENLKTNFVEEFELIHLQEIFINHANMEIRHSQTYAKQLLSLLRSEEEVAKQLRDLNGSEPILAKYKWMSENFSADKSLLHRIFSTCVAEGVLFQVSFLFIFALKKSNCDMPGLFKANEYISRDEGLHCSFFAYLYQQLRSSCVKNVSLDSCREALRSAIEIEKTFAKFCFAPILEDSTINLAGLTIEKLEAYVDYIGSYIYSMLEGIEDGPRENPCAYIMDQFSQEVKNLIFEVKTTEYFTGTGCTSFDDIVYNHI